MAEPTTVTVDAKGMPQLPADPNVKIPPAVKAAADAADAIHQQTYQPPAPATPEPTPAPTPEPITAPAPAPTPEPPKAIAPVSDRSDWDVAKWQQHAKSMEGRFRQSQDQIQTLQGHLSEMGTELVAWQNRAPLVPPQSPQQSPQPQQQPLPPVQKFLTKEDVDTYGEDFLNAAQRAAMQAVSPQLTALQRQNEDLRRQLSRTTATSMEASLDAQVPNWSIINANPRWKNWLRLRDVYSGRLRNEMLNEAYRSGQSDRVVAFFRGFLAEEEATGQTEFLPQSEPAQPTPPRVAAVELNTLAAPGHAKPAVGNQPNAPASEPIWITRAQIAQYYDNVRRQVYAGREQDRLNDEAIIFECQRAGRVR